jgi:hypothetical protein
MAEMNQTVPQFQYPDLLGSYIRGAMAPGEMQAQQQQNTMGQLQIDQLRMAMGNRQMLRWYFMSQAGSAQEGGSNSPPDGSQIAGTQFVSGPKGGRQVGPQSVVSTPQGGQAGPPLREQGTFFYLCSLFDRCIELT